jgi:hypothetical protein
MPLCVFCLLTLDHTSRKQNTILGIIALAEKLDCKVKLSWELINTVILKQGVKCYTSGLKSS